MKWLSVCFGYLVKVCYRILFIARIRSLREGNVFSSVCLSVSLSVCLFNSIGESHVTFPMMHWETSLWIELNRLTELNRADWQGSLWPFPWCTGDPPQKDQLGRTAGRTWEGGPGYPSSPPEGPAGYPLSHSPSEGPAGKDYWKDLGRRAWVPPPPKDQLGLSISKWAVGLRLKGFLV